MPVLRLPLRINTLAGVRAVHGDRRRIQLRNQVLAGPEDVQPWRAPDAVTHGRHTGNSPALSCASDAELPLSGARRIGYPLSPTGVRGRAAA